MEIEDKINPCKGCKFKKSLCAVYTENPSRRNVWKS